MELFKYRNLALGCGFYLVFLLLSYYFNTVIRIAILALSGVAIITAILIYLISRRGLKALIRLIPIFSFIALSMIASLLSFDKNELFKYCDGNTEYNIECTVEAVDYSSDTMGIYTINVHRVEENQIDKRAKLYTFGKPLQRGSVVFLKGTLTKIESDTLGFDERGYNLSKGIEVAIDSEEYSVTGQKSSLLTDIMLNVNSYLDGILAKIGNNDTYSLLTALFLGNTKSLEPNVKRDFTRLGLSHALALSGMHITIVIALLGFLVNSLPIRKAFKILLLSISALFFVGMTGFSDSAIRACIMVCLVYLLSIFGRRTSLSTALFISVTIICIFDPYSVFSLSLILSFFAMLGCVTSSQIFKKLKLIKRVKNKVLRYVMFTAVTSTFAVLFTLPITYFSFGSIPILSPITNIFFSPIFTFLIYLTPIYLVLSPIPYISSAIGWILTQASTFLLFAGERIAALKGILIPIITHTQNIGIFIAVIFVISLLIMNKRLYKFALVGITCGIVIFIVGTGILHFDRKNNVYIGSSCNSSSETLFIEDEGGLTIYELGSSSSLAYYTAMHLGYYEVENFILTDYNSKSASLIKTMCSSLLVKHIYIPYPITDHEAMIYGQAFEIATRVGASLEFLYDSHTTSNTNAYIYRHYIQRSEKPIVAISVDCSNARLTYLSASSYEAPTYTVNELAYKSDALIFGSYGPNFKVNYKYDVPYLDFAVFLGDSQKYAQEEFYKSVQDKIKP